MSKYFCISNMNFYTESDLNQLAPDPLKLRTYKTKNPKPQHKVTL